MSWWMLIPIAILLVVALLWFGLVVFPAFLLIKNVRKGRKLLWGMIILLVISTVPYLNFLSPLVITPPVFGKVTNAITGAPVFGYEVSSSLTIDALSFESASFHADKIETLSNLRGYFFIRPHVTLKLPLIHWLNFDRSPPSSYEHVLNFILFKYKKIKVIPRFVNPNLCTNPGSAFKPDEESIRQCQINMIALILNNTPELCDSFDCSYSDCKKFCKKEIQAVYQDIAREDNCMRQEYKNYSKQIVDYFDVNCLISKAIKFKDPNICNEKIDYSKRNGATTNLLGYGTDDGWMTSRDACLTLVAYNVGRADICDQIKYDSEKKWCHYFLSQKNAKTLADFKFLE